MNTKDRIYRMAGRYRNWSALMDAYKLTGHTVEEFTNCGRHANVSKDGITILVSEGAFGINTTLDVTDC